MVTFFQKLRKLNESDKEDFLTEIFAFALISDENFRHTFFLRFLPKGFFSSEQISIETQVRYSEEKKKPDIEISSFSSFLIIENKVDSKEGDNQLKSYYEILKQKNHANKLLVYLTVQKEEKNHQFDGVGFISLRWLDISRIIDDKCNIITQELKKYLINEKLVMEKLSYQDLFSLKSFFDTASKMQDILNEVTRDFAKSLYNYINWQKTTTGREYVISYRYYNPTFIVSFGFGDWWGEHPCIFFRIAVAKRDSDDITKLIYSEIQHDSWYHIKNDTHFLVETRKPIIDFLKMEDNQRQEIIAFFKKAIDEISEVKKLHRDIFNPPKKRSSPQYDEE